MSKSHIFLLLCFSLPLMMCSRSAKTVQHPLGIFIPLDDQLDARLKAAASLEIPTAHLGPPSAEWRTPEAAEKLKSNLKRAQITPTVVFCGFAGESYADIPTVRKTVGLVPKETRSQRLAEAKHISDFAKALSVPAVGLHVGFIPEDPGNPDYPEIVTTVQELADYCKSNGQQLRFETGQETGPALLQFLHDLGRDNVAVNFDPANMILYGTGEPIEALRMVGKHVRSVHCKDAKWAEHPGEEWGEEVPLGHGDVNMKLFLQTLKEIGYVGPLTIEREIAGEQQLKDIAEGARLLRQLRKEIWKE